MRREERVTVQGPSRSNNQMECHTGGVRGTAGASGFGFKCHRNFCQCGIVNSMLSLHKCTMLQKANARKWHREKHVG